MKPGKSNKMISKNKIKFISGLLIISIILPNILFSFPKKADAIWGIADVGVTFDATVAKLTGTTAVNTGVGTGSTLVNTATNLKTFAMKILEQVLKTVAKRVLAEMTKSVINWINSDFHGAPLFLENPESFFKDIAKSEVRNLVDMIGYDTLRFPFGPQTALGVIASYKNTLENSAQYSLSKVINDPDLLRRYRNDFNVGGWNGFLINTQYPQNNYLGFNMIIQQNLASRLEGTLVAPANKIKSLLQEGQGFLSPQTCPSNPAYNNGYNEFNKPSFKPSTKYTPYNADGELLSRLGEPGANEELEKRAKAHDAEYNARLAVEKSNWEKANTCPGGLVNTTPGSVASAQIAGALNAPFLTTALDGALGNSLSAIFDALLNKFIGDGLNALASAVNPAPVSDDWSYNGQTLGSPIGSGPNSTWNTGPDQPIVLSEFKKMVDDGITGTIAELKLIYNDTPNEPGIYQMFGKIWPKARELDKCIPGPDVVGLQGRMDAEIARIDKKLQEASGGSGFGSDQKVMEDADKVSQELNLAMRVFKEWIENKMMPELPSSLIFMDSVRGIKSLSQDLDAINDKRIEKNRALVRLRAIKTNLDTVTIQPVPGSGEEKILISLWKQYQSANTDISNTNSIESTRNKLSTMKDTYTDLANSMDPSNPLGCPAQRTAKGWSNPGGPNSKFGGKKEITLFCSLPIMGGYTHQPFINYTGVKYPEIPLINAQNVLKYRQITLISFMKSIDPVEGFNGFSPSEDAFLNVRINCNNIFSAGVLEYKGSLPGSITMDLTDPTNATAPEDVLGNCEYDNGIIETDITRADCVSTTGAKWGPLEPLGTCTLHSTPIPDTTKSACKDKGGKWSENAN